MDAEKLRTEIDQLRSALKAVDAGVATSDPSPEALQDFGLAVDNLRKSLWAGLTAKYSDDYGALLGMIRFRRATETWEDVLADLQAATLAPNTPGIEVFSATLGELAELF